jgi:hypothetical protein
MVQLSDDFGFVWTVPKDADRHKFARDGDHLITPFQCDLCVFHCLMGHNPASQYVLLLSCIRQVNLDTLWDRETATVEANHRSLNKLLQLWSLLGISPNLPVFGPCPLDGQFGYSIAVVMVLKSREPGHYAHYKQYETNHKL